VQAEEEALKLATMRDGYEKRLRDLQTEHKTLLEQLASEKVGLVSDRMTMEMQVKEVLAEREVSSMGVGVGACVGACVGAECWWRREVEGREERRGMGGELGSVGALTNSAAVTAAAPRCLIEERLRLPCLPLLRHSARSSLGHMSHSKICSSFINVCVSVCVHVYGCVCTWGVRLWQEERRSANHRVEDALAKKKEAEGTLQIRMIEYERVTKLLASTQSELRRMREAAVKEGDETAAQVGCLDPASVPCCHVAMLPCCHVAMLPCCHVDMFSECMS
jgi:hypothetical protein